MEIKRTLSMEWTPIDESSARVKRVFEGTPHHDVAFEMQHNPHELKRDKHPRSIILISAAPGGGKDSVVDAFTQQDTFALPFERFRTSTTRPWEERDGQPDPYNRLTIEEFKEAEALGDFLETNQHHGNWYGSTISEFERIWANGRQPIVRVDPNGALNMRKMWQDNTHPFQNVNFVYFFLTAPTLKDYWERTVTRGMQNGTVSREDSERKIADRWPTIMSDLGHITEAHYVIVNHTDRLHDAVTAINLLVEHHCVVRERE